MLVPVFDANNKLSHYTKPAKARWLLNTQKASCRIRDGIFSIRMLVNRISLKDYLINQLSVTSEYRIGIDPGVHHTGISLSLQVGDMAILLFGINLHHRKDISKKLEKRKAARSHRRSRKWNKAIRTPRLPEDIIVTEDYQNWISPKKYKTSKPDKKPKGWLAPSIVARMESIVRWVRTLLKYCFFHPRITVEDLHFPPDYAREIEHSIKHTEMRNDPKRGITASTKTEYVKWLNDYTCQYCGYNSRKSKEKRKLTKDHIVPRAKGGSDQLENLTCACLQCNQDKSDTLLEDWYKVAGKKRQPYIKKVMEEYGSVKTRKYSALSTATRKWFLLFLTDMVYDLKDSEIDYYKWLRYEYRANIHLVCRQVGYITAQMRRKLSLKKDHWVDALCCGISFDTRKAIFNYGTVFNVDKRRTGNRQFVLMNAQGFPRIKKVIKKDKDGNRIKPAIVILQEPKSKHGRRMEKNIYFLKPWDLVKATHKKIGTVIDYVSTVKKDGRIKLMFSKFETTSRSFTDIEILELSNGYVAYPV